MPAATVASDSNGDATAAATAASSIGTGPGFGVSTLYFAARDRGKPWVTGVSYKEGERLPHTARTHREEGVTQTQMMLFVFPASLEHPESTGRLELFARYGPVDINGKLRGGIGGSHIHTDLEIRQMIRHETREKLFALFKKPRETVEVIVDGLMPAAMENNYTWKEVKDLLKPCFQAAMDAGTGRLNFRDMQKIILHSQTQRLQVLIKEGRLSKQRGPKVAFQSKAAETLYGPVSKKKLNDQEEQYFKTKRLNRFAALVAGMEDMHLTQQISGNTTLCRMLGDPDDKWDRYCAVRRCGKSSYVKARNEPHSGTSIDDGFSNKHPGISSLISAGYAKGPTF